MKRYRQLHTMVEPGQLALLRSEAERRGVSLAHLVRQLLDEWTAPRAHRARRALMAKAGFIRGRLPRDAARDHDSHLYEA